MNPKQDIIGRKEKRRAILFVVFVILFFFSAYIYNNRAFVLMRAGSFFNIEELILPASLDSQVIEMIGLIDYENWLEDGTYSFSKRREGIPTVTDVKNYKLVDRYIYTRKTGKNYYFSK
ncbi:hypothetical protein IPN35_03965 [Candidatus Peregrinibacteria bacterium]|nr:MAG: hypothetical protein IPN35_03965 [Candidatus Peregrinibacteria bacterium]